MAYVGDINTGSKVSELKACLSDTLDQLARYNSSQREYIYSIEDKLHTILNKRAPEAKSVALGDVVQSPDDFVGAFSREVENVFKQNERLERIYRHLNELI